MVLIRLHCCLSLLASLGFAVDIVLSIHIFPAGLLPIFDACNSQLDKSRQHSLKNKPAPNA